MPQEPTSRWTPRLELLAFVAFALVVTAVCLRPVLHAPGWPVNHDGAKMFFRTEVFAAHFRQGDLFPVWSGSDAIGFGTPMPSYYQRFYFTIAGALLLVTHDLKSATLLTMSALMLVGALGMRAAVGVLTGNRAVQYAAAAGLLLSHYAFTDWLVRGAAAEFSAMMLVPWLLWWSLKLVVDRAFSLWIVPIFGLLFYAHNAIALVSIPVPLLAFVLYLVSLGRARELQPRVLLRPALAAVLTALLAAPALLMQLRMNADFDPTTKITEQFTIAGGFRDAADYLHDSSYTWLTSGGGYTVQLNLVATVTFAVLLALGVVRWLRARRAPGPAAWLVLVPLAGYLFLQLRVSQGTYDVVPLLPQIQFPWRMLTLITPLLLLGIALLGRTRGGHRWWPAVAAVWVVAYAVASPAIASDRLPRLDTLSSRSDGFYESGEYTPRTLAPDGSRELTGNELMAVYAQQAAEVHPCALHELDHAFERLERRFALDCPTAGRQALPLTFSRYSRVEVGDRTAQPIRSPQDPRLLVDVPAGPVVVTVLEPTFWRVLR